MENRLQHQILHLMIQRSQSFKISMRVIIIQTLRKKRGIGVRQLLPLSYRLKLKQLDFM